MITILLLISILKKNNTKISINLISLIPTTLCLRMILVKDILVPRFVLMITIEIPECFVLQLFRFKEYLIKINLSYS